MARDGVRAIARSARRFLKARQSARAGQEPSVARVQGFHLELPTHFRSHYVDRDYEPMSRRFLLDHVPEGGRAVDIGGHIGLYTLLLARAVGPSGNVIAVEPAPENLRYLRANVAANGFGDRVEVVAAAATDFTGSVQFHITGSSDSHGLHPHPNTATKRLVRVPAVRLDDVVADVDFIKIDTEGAEIATLAGIRSVMTAPGRRAALVEWAPRCQANAGKGLTDLVDALGGLGYELTVLDDYAGTERSVAEVTEDLRSGALGDDWYGNIACVRKA